MAESEEKQKSLLMEVKKETEKAGLILNIQKTKIIVSGPIPSWQIHGQKIETVRDLIFLGSKIIVDVDSSHEIKRRLLFGRKAMTNLASILKRRDITLPTKEAGCGSVCVLVLHTQSIITQPSRTHRPLPLLFPACCSQAWVAVDRAEVLEPGCSSLNPGPESGARRTGRMLVSTDQGCTKDVS